MNTNVSALGCLALCSLLSVGSVSAMAEDSPASTSPPPFVAHQIPTPTLKGELPLYPDVAPGSEDAQQREEWDDLSGQRIVRNVTRPTLTPVLPPLHKANGMGVVIAPGGGYMMLSMDREGFDVAHWLAAHGVAAFVLKYRVNASTPDAAQFGADFTELIETGARNVAAGEPPPPVSEPLSVDDAQAAVRYVRDHAKLWHVLPTRIGLLGFSAGAITGIELLKRAGAPDAELVNLPDFVALLYPPMEAIEVPDLAPPLFVGLARDDPLFGTAEFGLVSAWRQANKPVELHFYEGGGHGFGMGKPGTTSMHWIEQFNAWLQSDLFKVKP